jgi:hypothetical protein
MMSAMPFLILGMVIGIASWIAAWGHLGIFGEYSFLPLWIGYILAINGVSEIHFQTSLLRIMKWQFSLLYAGSIPLWWFFELINRVVGNWEYVLPHPVSDLHYAIQASLNFGTVLPAVLSTAFVAHQLLQGWELDATGSGWKIRRWHLIGMVTLGLISFLGLWWSPRETFPLVWIAPILILEPLAYVSRLPSLLAELSHGHYRVTIAVMSATFFTGIWWELWNFYSLPKWIYHIPYVGFWKIFEMPFLGYFGYPFFGLIVFSWASIVMVTFGNRDLINTFQNRA